MIVLLLKNDLSLMKSEMDFVFSENQIQDFTIKRVSFCAALCLYILHLTKVLARDSTTVVLKLYYQTFS